MLYVAAVRCEDGEGHVIALAADLAGRPQLIVPQSALCAAEMEVEYVGADKIVTASHLAHRAVFELEQDGDGAVKFQVRAHFAGLGVYGYHLVPHEPAHGVHRVAAAGQQRASAHAFLAGPLITGDVAHNPVEIVGLGIFQLADEIPLQLLRRHEQGVIVEHIAHQRLDARLSHRLIHALGVLPGQRHRLFNQDVLSRFGGHNGLFTVHVIGGTDNHDVHTGVPQALLVVGVHSAAALQAVFPHFGLAPLLRPGDNGCHLGLLRHFERADMLSRHPSGSDDHNAIFFHHCIVSFPVN